MGSLLSSPGKQAQQAAQAQQGLSAQTVAQAEQYANTTGTNVQNAIANAGPNPYFGAAQYLSPQSYALNPSQTTTFGENGPPGTMSGNNFQFSQPLPASSLGNSATTRRTQPIAESANAQSANQAPPPTQSTTKNPFSSGQHNTEALAALLGL